MKALRMFVWLAILVGIIYPFFVLLIAQITVPWMANGSLIQNKDIVAGSVLIGQKFESESYFWSRPSAVDYATLPAGGSYLGPTNQKLKTLVEKRKKTLEKIYKTKSIPSELIYASGSGLDPHITSEGAYLQIERVAVARNMEIKELQKIVESFIQKRRFGFLGVKSINVLKLNLALDQKDEHERRKTRS